MRPVCKPSRRRAGSARSVLMAALVLVPAVQGRAQTAPPDLAGMGQWLAARPSQIEWAFDEASRSKVPNSVTIRFRQDGPASYRPDSLVVQGCDGPPIELGNADFAGLPGITVRIELYANPGLNRRCDTRSLTFWIYQSVDGTGGQVQRWDVRADVGEVARLYGPNIKWRAANI
jgi:hypothetical protein